MNKQTNQTDEVFARRLPTKLMLSLRTYFCSRFAIKLQKKKQNKTKAKIRIDIDLAYQEIIYIILYFIQLI